MAGNARACGDSRALVVICSVLALRLAGCRLDMHVQPKYMPYEPTDFFRDGRSERPAGGGNGGARAIAA